MIREQECAFCGTRFGDNSSKRQLMGYIAEHHTESLISENYKVQRQKMGKDHLGADQRKVRLQLRGLFSNISDQVKEVDEEEKEIKALDEKDIALLKSYGQGQYTKALKVSRGLTFYK